VPHPPIREGTRRAGDHRQEHSGGHAGRGRPRHRRLPAGRRRAVPDPGHAAAVQQGAARAAELLLRRAPGGPGRLRRRRAGHPRPLRQRGRVHPVPRRGGRRGRHHLLGGGPAMEHRSGRDDRWLLLRGDPVAGRERGAAGTQGDRLVRHHRPVLRELGLPGRRVPAGLQPALVAVVAGPWRDDAPARHRRGQAGRPDGSDRCCRRQRGALPAHPAARPARAGGPGRLLRRLARPPRPTTGSGGAARPGSATARSPRRR
jgi:hypothetical protein